MKVEQNIMRGPTSTRTDWYRYKMPRLPFKDGKSSHRAQEATGEN